MWFIVTPIDSVGLRSSGGAILWRYMVRAFPPKKIKLPFAIPVDQSSHPRGRHCQQELIDEHKLQCRRNRHPVHFYERKNRSCLDGDYVHLPSDMFTACSATTRRTPASLTSARARCAARSVRRLNPLHLPRPIPTASTPSCQSPGQKLLSTPSSFQLKRAITPLNLPMLVLVRIRL
jgi:hypothetical protein